MIKEILAYIGFVAILFVAVVAYTLWQIPRIVGIFVMEFWIQIVCGCFLWTLVKLNAYGVI